MARVSRQKKTYERLVSQLKHAQLAMERAQNRQKVLSTKVAPLIDQQITDIKKLIDLGELDVLLLQDVLERSFKTRTAILDAAVAQAIANDSIQSLLAPQSVTRPAPRPTETSNKKGAE